MGLSNLFISRSLQYLPPNPQKITSTVSSPSTNIVRGFDRRYRKQLSQYQNKILNRGTEEPLMELKSDDSGYSFRINLHVLTHPFKLYKNLRSLNFNCSMNRNSEYNFDATRIENQWKGWWNKRVLSQLACRTVRLNDCCPWSFPNWHIMVLHTLKRTGPFRFVDIYQGVYLRTKLYVCKKKKLFFSLFTG